MPETLVCLRETQVREPPGEILLIPFGKVEYTKDNKVGSFNFDSESAQKILAEFSERGRDLVIDYEHQTLSGEQAPAAGWIEKLELNERGRGRENEILDRRCGKLSAQRRIPLLFPDHPI